jgi:phage tail tape-measure protein
MNESPQQKSMSLSYYTSRRRHEHEAEAAVGGALAGAAMGAIAGPPGAVAGAIIGCAIGAAVAMTLENGATDEAARIKRLEAEIVFVPRDRDRPLLMRRRAPHRGPS